MRYHLERLFHVNPVRKYSFFADWTIIEYDENGKVIADDYAPWVWALSYSATSCNLSDEIVMDRKTGLSTEPLKDDTTTTVRQSIRMNLRPSSRLGRFGRRSTDFMMFGTGRYIKRFALHVIPIDDPSVEEQCNAWGCPSYSSEIDFVEETQEDCVEFRMWVKRETFSSYESIIRSNSISAIEFDIGAASGFYASAGPDISTDLVKILVRDPEHKLSGDAPSDIELPRLGPVGEATLRFISSAWLNDSEARNLD